MDSSTIEGLAHHFRTKVSILKDTVILADAINDKDNSTISNKINNTLEEIERVVKLLKNDVKEQKQLLEEVKVSQDNTLSFSQKVQHAKDNIPSHMDPRRPEVSTAPTPTPVKGRGTAITPAKETPRSGMMVYLSFLTIEEFDLVPKYMKGRLAYEKVNTIIEKLNQAYVEKYKILKKKKSTLNDANRKRYENYKLQETKDTIDAEFITEADITELCGLRVDSALRAILTVLRHCNLIYEIRGGGLVRYAASRNYY